LKLDSTKHVKVINKSIRLKREDALATDILQSFKMSLKIIAIVATIKILMSVRHVTVVANAVLHPLQLTAKIIATMLRNRTNIHNVFESDQCVDLIPKIFISKIGRD
jgi:hypothetical protein